MAIELIQVPLGARASNVRAAGIFSLPQEFDIKQYASKWAKTGQDAASAQEREHLVGSNLTADGWEVWKRGGSSGKPLIVHAQSGDYVLLCRRREIQDSVNAIYGNIGKERMMAEKRGETTGGVPVQDPGQLGDERLAQVIGRDAVTQEEGQIILNPVSDVKRVTVPTLMTSEAEVPTS
jgi:hypothetical protein